MATYSPGATPSNSATPVVTPALRPWTAELLPTSLPSPPNSPRPSSFRTSSLSNTSSRTTTSTSSSISVSNLAAMRAHVEDSGVTLQDQKVHLPLSESIESETVVASVISHP
uniref:Uncharacterized protein n=1 Tax=Vitis vinifera TaxID=29760 RepID=F6H7Q3_VITVI